MAAQTAPTTETAAPAPTFETVIADLVGKPDAKPAAPESGWPGEIVEVPDEGGGEEVIDTTEEADPEPVDEQPAEEGEPAPVLLQEYRSNGKLDEGKVAEQLNFHAANTKSIENINALLAEDMDLRKQWAKSLKKRGIALAPEWDALTVEPVKPAVQYDMKAVYAKYNEIFATGDAARAAIFLDKYVVQPREEARNQQVAEERKRLADEAMQRQKAAEHAQQQTRWNGWVNEAKTSYPKLIKPLPNGSFDILDKGVADAYTALVNEGSGHLPVKTILELALLRKGKLGKPAPSVAQPAPLRRAARPAIAPRSRQRDEGPMYTPIVEILPKK